MSITTKTTTVAPDFMTYAQTNEFKALAKSMKVDNAIASALVVAYCNAVFNYKVVTHGNHLRAKAAGIADTMIILGASLELVDNLRGRVFPSARKTAPAQKKEVTLG